MIDGLLKISEILLGRRDKLREAKAEHRKRVSLYFENVSRCLSDIAAALKTGTAPWQACGELDAYEHEANRWWDAKNETLVAKVFGEELAHSLGIELFHLTSARGGAIVVLSRLQSGEYRRPPFYFGSLSPQEFLSESIIEIEQAAGRFKALSVLALTSGS